MTLRLARLTKLMVEYYRGDCGRIKHFLNVHQLAATIGRLENIEEFSMDVLEAAAIVHEAGISLCREESGSSDSRLTVRKGSAEARMLLKRTGGFTDEETDRITHLVEVHRSFTAVEGIDHQILTEAIILDEIDKGLYPGIGIAELSRLYFRTKTGRELLDAMHGGKPWTMAPQDDKNPSCC